MELTHPAMLAGPGKHVFVHLVCDLGRASESGWAFIATCDQSLKG